MGASALAFTAKKAQEASLAEAQAEDPLQKKIDEEERKTFFQKNVIDFKQIAKEEFKIPHLLQEREKAK